jgi:hypothetical protein
MTVAGYVNSIQNIHLQLKNRLGEATGKKTKLLKINKYAYSARTKE